MVRNVRPIRIGNQTALSASTPMEPFEYAVAHGFDAFEWFPDKKPDNRGWTEDDLSTAARALVRRTAREHDIALSVHGVWDASPLTAGDLERLMSQAEFAAELGASVFVVHLFPDEGLEHYVEAIATLIARLARDGIRLAVENTPETSARDFNELFGCFRRRGPQATAVGMCLDVGHANLYAGTRDNYLAYVDGLAPETTIAHVHLHENWGDQDSHLTLFTGPAARDATGVAMLADRLVQRDFAGCIILEQWPQPPALLDAARNRLADLLAVRRLAGPTSATQRHS